jgi:hypothetical protein
MRYNLGLATMLYIASGFFLCIDINLEGNIDRQKHENKNIGIKKIPDKCK